MTRIIGIDLGTTNSLVAYHENDGTKIIPDRNGQELLPSVVAFLTQDEFVLGAKAKELLKSMPQNCIYSSKRYIGKNKLEEKTNPKLVEKDQQLFFHVHGKDYKAYEIAAFILAELKKRAEQYFNEEISDCVITVPAYFNDNQRNETKLAAQLAGLKLRKMINEPTAAALAYGLDKKDDSITAVYDLGGGTFDISILKLHEGIFEVLSTNGDTNLGGDDFDFDLLQLIQEKLNLTDNENPDLKEYLRQIAEEAKKKLSELKAVKLKLRFKDILPEQELYIERTEFNTAITPNLNRTKRSVRQALRDAQLSFEEIDHIILVGGSTRIPFLQESISQWFSKAPYKEIDPDKAVAIGAAIQAGILSGDILETVLLDVTPLSLGMEIVGGVTEKFIMRNSKIPCSATETFTTSVDNQSAVSIHIVQGERELAADNFSLGKFSLKNIEPMAAGLPRIDVRFQLDANGILSVEAEDKRSGAKNSVEIHAMSKLTDEKVEAMLMESFSKAKTDMTERQRIDAITEAKAVILATERALREHSQLITKDEKEQLELLLLELSSLFNSDADHNKILDKTDELDKNSQKFAEIIMDSSIQRALTEKKLSDI